MLQKNINSLEGNKQKKPYITTLKKNQKAPNKQDIRVKNCIQHVKVINLQYFNWTLNVTDAL